MQNFHRRREDIYQKLSDIIKMFGFFKRFFRKFEKNEVQQLSSGSAAKERLNMVLMQDRANVSADYIDMMKQDIIDDIKKYIDVDEKEIDVRLTNQIRNDGSNGIPALYANIPISNIKSDKYIANNSKNIGDTIVKKEVIKNSILNLDNDKNEELSGTKKATKASTTKKIKSEKTTTSKRSKNEATTEKNTTVDEKEKTEKVSTKSKKNAEAGSKKTTKKKTTVKAAE